MVEQHEGTQPGATAPHEGICPDHVWVANRAEHYGLGYRNNTTILRGVALDEIARVAGTPTYVYDSAGILTRLARVQGSLAQPSGSLGEALVCYAVKANSALAVLRLLGRAGAGADIVSGGELLRAIAAGIPPKRILFSGVGKTTDELDAAIATDILAVNVESGEELRRLSARAAAAHRMVDIALRVNPDVDAKTHPYLATGLQNSKFGVSMADATPLAMMALADPGLRLIGLGCHIGSQIVEPAPYRDSVLRLSTLVGQWRDQGIELRHLDVGGGLGVAYRPGDPELDTVAWGRGVREASDALGLRLVVEPGRYLVAESGFLLTRVVGTKQTASRSFVIVDAAMNDLIRPALYEAYHAVVPVKTPAMDTQLIEVDVVGPVCESGDFLARERALPPVGAGDLLMLMNAGAYGMTMASTYNSRSLPAEVLVEAGRFAVIRARKPIAESLLDEAIPPWW